MAAYLEIALPPLDFGEFPDLRVVGDVPHLDAWLEAVTDAEEPCLLLDAGGVVLGVSPACVPLLGVEDADELLGAGLLDDVIELLDFTASAAALLPDEVERIPPVQAVATGALSRGLLRVRCGDRIRTLDAVSSPLRAHGQVVGSLTFFHSI